MVVAQVLLAVAYPFLVYFSLGYLEPRAVAGLFIVLVGLRFLGRLMSPGIPVAGDRKTVDPKGLAGAEATRTGTQTWGAILHAVGLPALGIIAVMLCTAVSNDPLLLLLAPALVNGVLLASFAGSMFGEMSTVERIAKLQVSDLTAEETRYARRVTLVWCGFFAFNGAIALILAVGDDLDLWALYTGLIGYVLIGLLFASEYLYRHWRFRRYVGNVTDPILMRFFPPLDPPRGEPSPPRLPEILSREDSETHRRFLVRVPEDLVYLPDHFPGQPIVPGVVQLGWVLHFLEQWCGRSLAVREILGLKYKRPLLPSEEVAIDIEADPGFASASFEITGGDAVYSLGRLKLVSEARLESTP